MPDLSNSDVLIRVRDLLNDWPWRTTSTTTDTLATVAVPDGTLWAFGDIGEWQTGTTGYEQFYVQSVSGNNLTTTRGINGTTAETHTSGDAVFKNPTWSGRNIQQAVNQAILELWPWVWKTGTISLTPSTTTFWYNLNALTFGIVNVAQLYGSSSQFVGFFKDKYYGKGKTYIVRRNIPTGLVASGNGIRFSSLFDATNTITVTDIRAITGTTDIADSGLLPVAEAVAYGAVARLLKAMEMRRISSGESQDVAATVSQGARLQTGVWWEGEFRRRLQSLQKRLHTTYNPDSVWR